MKLFQSFELAPGLTLPNRIVMAPMTRNRAGEGNVPTDLMVEYYRQRASFGLIITEATPVSESAHGYPATPGIYTEQQIEGWKKVTDAVHDAGGHIVLQLWHCGRISHQDYQPDKRLPPSASPIAARNSIIMKPDFSIVENLIKPRELTPDEIDFIIDDFRIATRNARQAGFDGVEIHGANGFLINQFLYDGSNKRQDSYGGSIENRARFLFEILDAVTTEWPERVGLRLSPTGTFNDMEDSNREALYNSVIERLNEYDLIYLHILEPRMFESYSMATYDLPLSSKTWRPLFKGSLISSGGHLKESANILLNHAQADLIAFGRLAISNPDLPERFVKDAPLNDYDRDSFYGGAEVGYTDYPTLSEMENSNVRIFQPHHEEEAPSETEITPETSQLEEAEQFVATTDENEAAAPRLPEIPEDEKVFSLFDDPRADSTSESDAR